MEIKRVKYVRYGLGGFDATKPNNNIVEEYEYDEPAIPKIEKVKFLVYLSRIGKYQILINKLSTLSEEHRIIYNHTEYFEIGSGITEVLKNHLGVTDLQLQSAFNRANEIKI